MKKNIRIDEELIGYGTTKVWSNKYRGGNNPHRKGTYNYQLWETDKDWWMNNLNIDIIRDYLKELDWRMNSLEFQIEHAEEINEILKN